MTQPVRNFLLDAYARKTGVTLASRFEAVPLPFKAVLYQQEERPRYVHFLTSGVSSLVTSLREGRDVEVAMTAHEGFPEALYLLGPEPSNRNCFMQVQGTALRMRFAEFERLFLEDAALRTLVFRVIQYQGLMSGQLVACNGQHDAEERLARWLLMVQDRVEDSDLPLTQEFLGQMLGARRSTVTIAASNLQRAGLIDYRRGSIRILDRERLAEIACECYEVIRQLYANLYLR
jgi:CRP-like cAMP-binding protein